MKNNDRVTIIESCADLTVRCLADSGICDWKTAFDQQIANAKKLGLMPDDFKVIRETLQNFGFTMQNTAVEGLQAERVFEYLDDLGPSATVILHISDYVHAGGRMIAFRTEGKEYVPVVPLPYVSYLVRHRVSHVWIRWDDGVDRSPYPRKKVNRRSKAASERKETAETGCFKPFQPNPCNNYIGDCVVRATAGAMDISWNEAIDVLTSGRKLMVNIREVYIPVLEKQGFVRCSPLTQGGSKLYGKAFCDEMDKMYHNGERIFAYVGRHHVAAIVPVADESGNKSYKIIDSWDSSGKPVGEYLVLSAEKPA